jgi:cytochrome c biogenesis protein CcmG, thiol:disulfide interchange protein DsbE
MLGIDFLDTKPRAQAFHRRYGWTWPSLWDPRGRIAARVKALGTPTVVFLDRSHRIVARIVGGADLAVLERTYRSQVR